MSGERPPSGGAKASSVALFGVASGAVAMILLWLLSSVAPLLLALLAGGVVAGAGGAVSASRLRRGPAGANLAGIYALIGAALVAVPVLLAGVSSLNDTQVVLFGLALAAISAMCGQVQGGR